MRFEQRLRDGIHSGAIVLAFRRWKRSQVSGIRCSLAPGDCHTGLVDSRYG